MANPYTDPKYAMARLMTSQQASPSPLPVFNAPSKTSVQLGRMASNAATANPSLRDAINNIAAGKKPASSNVIGNIVKAPLKGLEAFAIPGRVVVSGLKEFADVSDKDPTTKGSFRDFGKQIADPTFGFGKAFKVDTGNIWVDRAIGFVGDVALDPLTYATFGAGKFAGYSGRLKLANEVLKVTGDNALASTVARVGRSALRNSPDVLERVGANKFGVYMFGKRIKIGENGILRIPMTGTIGEIAESTLAKARLAITDTRLGKYMQKLGMPKDFLDYRLGLARGTLAPEVAADAIKLFEIRPAQRAAAAKFAQEFEQELMATLKSEEPFLESYRKTVYKFVEDPSKLANATEQERRAYELWSKYLDNKWNQVDSSWKSVDEFAQVGRTKNYFPRVVTDEGRKFMNSDGEYAAQLRAIYQEDPLALVDSFTPRSLKKGSKFFGYTLKESDLTIDRLNQIAREEGKINFDFFETDVVNVMRKYVHDTAQELGVVERNRLLAETGFFQKVKEAKIRQLEIDEDAVRAARSGLENAESTLAAAQDELKNSLGDFVSTIRSQSAKVDAGIVTGKSLLDDINRYVLELPEALAKTRKEFEVTKNFLISLFDSENGSIPNNIPIYAGTEDFPVTIRPLVEKFNKAASELARLEQMADDLAVEAGDELFGLGQIDSLVQRTQAMLDEVTALTDELKDSFDVAMKRSQILESIWDNIVHGKRLSSDAAADDVFKTIKNIIDARGDVPGAGQQARARALGATGRLRDFLRGVDSVRNSKEFRGASKFFDSVLNEVSGSGVSSISRKKVADMTPAQFEEILLSSLSGERTMDELRAAAAYAIGRDIRIYRASKANDLPQFVRKHHDFLRKVLRDAEQAEVLRSIVNNPSKGFGDVLDVLNSRWGGAYNNALRLSQDGLEMSTVVDFIEKDFAANFPDWASKVVTEEDVVAIAKGMQLKVSSSGKGFDARRGAATFLQEFIEPREIPVYGRNFEIVGTKPNPDYVEYTLGDIVTRLKARSKNAYDRYNNDVVEVDDIGANLLAGKKEKVTKKIKLTHSQIVERFEREVNRANNNMKLSKKAIASLYDANQTKAELADALVRYQAVSESVQKFEAVSAEFAKIGFTPDEATWRGIMRSVANQYGGQFQEKVNSVIAAENAMTEMHNAFLTSVQKMKNRIAEVNAAKASGVSTSSVNDEIMQIFGDSIFAIADPATKNGQAIIRSLTKAWQENGEIPVSVLFKDVLEQSLNGPNGNALRELLGPNIAHMVDPADLEEQRKILQSAVRSAPAGSPAKAAAKKQLDDWANNYLIPWAKNRNPNMRSNTGPAINELKSWFRETAGTSDQIRVSRRRDIAGVRGPLSKSASEDDINRWFSQFFKQVDDVSGETIQSGKIAELLNTYQDTVGFFRKMNDGYVDVEAFFDVLDGTADTPSGFAVMMIDLARKIEGATVLSEQNPIVRAAQRGAVGETYVEAYRRGPGVAEKAQKVADEAAIDAAKAKAIEDAFNNPNLPVSKLKKLGFTKSMIEAHQQMVDHQMFKASVEYSKALQDQDMINFLDQVAGINFAAFDDGIIVRMEQKPVFYGDAIDTSKSFDVEIEKLNAEKTKIVNDRNKSKRLVLQNYVETVNGKVVYKSNEHKKMANSALQEWQLGIGRDFDFKISQIDKQIANIETESTRTMQAVNIPDMESVPVFAKMPDGSNLKFSQAEWDSLFFPPYTRERLAKVGSELRGLTAQRKKLQAIADSLEGAWQPGKRAQLSSTRRKIAELDSAIAAKEMLIERNMVSVRNSALEKLRILTTGENKININNWQDAVGQLNVTGYDGLRRWGKIEFKNKLVGATDAEGNRFLKNVVEHSMSGGTPNHTLTHYMNKFDAANFGLNNQGNFDRYTGAFSSPELSRRRAGVRAMWNDNPSSAVIAKERELAEQVAASEYTDAVELSNRLQRALDSATSAANTARVAADDVQLSFKKTIEDLRQAEISAAKSVGAEITYADDVAGEIAYTFNGKTYKVPSLENMLRNPRLAASRAKSRGDIFFDIQKPGNVALWNSAPEEVRGVLGLRALQQQLIKSDLSELVNMKKVSEQRVAQIQRTIQKIFNKDIKGVKTVLDSVKPAIIASMLDEKIMMDAALDAVQGSYDELGKRLGIALSGTQKEYMDLFELSANLRASLEGFDPNIINISDVESLVSGLEKHSRLAQMVVDSLPSGKATKSLVGSTNPKTVQKWIQVHLDWIDGHRSLLRELAKSDLSNGGEMKIWETYLNVFAAEARFNLAHGRTNAANAALDTAKEGVYVEKVLTPAMDQFAKIAKSMLEPEGRVLADKFNLPSYSVNADVQKIMTNITKMNDAQTLRQLGRFLGTYTGFFKAYSTLSPGFHVRNSISNGFQMFAAGAEVKNMSQGLKLWRSLGEHIKNGGKLDDWIDSAAVPAALKKQAKIAAEAALALGGGKTDEAFAEFMRVGSSVITDNPATRASRKFGHRVEGSARFILAFDSAMKGMDFTESFNRTKRYLFDYNDPTIMDDMVRNVIPFWTWMSRNLPLQLINMWTNPKPYLIYKRFSDNFKVGEDNDTIPEYIAKHGLQFGRGLFITPDLPLSNAEDTLSNLGDPRKMLSMVNPGLRVPMELAGGREFFTGRPIEGTKQTLEYAARAALPMVGQAQRIARTGGTADEYALARYFGVPIRGVNEQTRENERKRRLYELQAFLDNNGGQ